MKSAPRRRSIRTCRSWSRPQWYAAFPIQLALSTDEAEKLENPPIRFDGSNVSGTGQLEQQFPEGETGMPVITYDFDVPGEEVDCDAL